VMCFMFSGVMASTLLTVSSSDHDVVFPYYVNKNTLLTPYHI
jgi:hypothetical protein